MLSLIMWEKLDYHPVLEVETVDEAKRMFNSLRYTNALVQDESGHTVATFTQEAYWQKETDHE